MGRLAIIGMTMVGLAAYGLSRPTSPPHVPAPLAQLPAVPPSQARPSPRPAPPRPPTTEAKATGDDIGGRAQQLPRPTSAAQSVPPPSPNANRTAIVLTTAAIAALLVAESRRAYYATGHPCACPEDRMRNGRACGGRSAYSRPGGASPLCYPTDVSQAMINAYRDRQLAAR